MNRGKYPIIQKSLRSILLDWKWKVVELVYEAKECRKIKEVIGQTQIFTAKVWGHL